MTMVPIELCNFVSRETQQNLASYVALIEKWNAKINLVAPSQIAEIWPRHIWDSAQIWPHLPTVMQHVDLGSGGGLPGLVLAIISKELSPRTRFSLIESDIRKAVFLRTVARDLGLNVAVHDKRFQFVPPARAGSMTARALASLNDLMFAAERHLSPDGVALFSKGARWSEEVVAAEANWSFHLEVIPSITEPQAAILKIKDIRRV